LLLPAPRKKAPFTISVHEIIPLFFKIDVKRVSMQHNLWELQMQTIQSCAIKQFEL
jgi:hypothetical protein